MKVFFDSSSLAKRYIKEEKSEQVDRLFLESDSVVVSSICLPEIVSALARLRREKKLNGAQYNQCKKSVVEDFAAFQICQLSPEVIKTSISLLEHAELRAMDALHVACALEAKAPLFVSSDERQNRAAKKFGLTINPV